MAPSETPRSGVITTGGTGVPAATGRSRSGGRPRKPQRVSAADPWPAWARAQLDLAIGIGRSTAANAPLAATLYREWFSPPVTTRARRPARRPLAGLYRSAHAGSRTRRIVDGVQVVDRHDVVGVDGWWRTWGETWTPPRRRAGSVRLLMTPHPDRWAEFVTLTTAALLPLGTPWSLACAADPRRAQRSGAAVLDLPSPADVPAGLLESLAPALVPVTPALSLPIAPGVGAATYPDNGMTFGEHRCHLVALALRHPCGADDPHRAVAAVFAAHGIDPAAPHRSR